MSSPHRISGVPLPEWTFSPVTGNAFSKLIHHKLILMQLRDVLQGLCWHLELSVLFLTVDHSRGDLGQTHLQALFSMGCHFKWQNQGSALENMFPHPRTSLQVRIDWFAN